MTLILAHRGYHHQHPENTLEAFEAALNMGAHGLELDVHFSKDGHLVVYHDFDLERLTGQHAYIFSYTLQDLKTLSIQGKYKIPSLAEVLERVATYSCHSTCGGKFLINVELKAGSAMYPGIEQAVLEACGPYNDHLDIIFSSFDHEAMVRLKALDGRAQTGLLTACALYEPWDYIKKAGADYYHPHYLSLWPNTLGALVDAGIRLNPYTVNDVQVATQLIAAGVHAIITDNLQALLDLVNP